MPDVTDAVPARRARAPWSALALAVLSAMLVGGALSIWAVDVESRNRALD